MNSNKEDQRAAQQAVNALGNLGVILLIVGLVVAILTPGWKIFIVFMLAFLGASLVGLAVAMGISYGALHQDKRHQPKINEKFIYAHGKKGKGKYKGFFK